VVGDELEALEANGFATGEATAQQTFTTSNDGEHRCWNHQNV
jgi:hypothetical protein